MSDQVLLTKETGTFLTFSNYVQDLTRWNATGEAVTPSKFIALDIKDTSYLQGDIEKLKENLSTLVENYIRYEGDINIHSYNEHEGVGYSEIYCHIPNDAKCFQYKEGLLTETNDTQYNINAIIVYYKKGDSQDQPLGVYITGKVENDGIQNSITKYVASSDIYNSGTSYGLRICTKYIVSPNSDNIIHEVVVESENQAELTQVLSQISISQQKMDEIINKCIDQNQNDKKNALNILLNNKTNVPYIKEVNGIKYWFVNGKMMTEVNCYDINNEYNDISNKDLEFIVSFTKLLDKSINDKTIEFKWKLFYKNKSVTPDKINYRINANKGGAGSIELKLINDTVTDEENGLNEIIFEQTESDYGYNVGVIDSENITNPITINLENLSTDDKITIEAEYGESIIAITKTVQVYPTYVGVVTKSEPTDTDIQNMNKKLLISKSQSHTFNIHNNEGEYICIAYPAIFGELNYITDNHNYIYYDKNRTNTTYNDFDKRSMMIHKQNYNVYIVKTPVCVQNQTLIFK